MSSLPRGIVMFTWERCMEGMAPNEFTFPQISSHKRCFKFVESFDGHASVDS